MQFKGAKQRIDGWYELGLFVAWHVAMFSRQTKLPELGPLLQKVKGTAAKFETKQSWQEVRANMAAHRAALAEPTTRKKRPVAVPALPRKGKR